MSQLRFGRGIAVRTAAATRISAQGLPARTRAVRRMGPGQGRMLKFQALQTP
jgi:hypothetical protein